MVIVMHAPAKGGAGAAEDGSDDRTAEFEVERERLVKMLTDGPIPVPKRTFGEDGKEGEADGQGGQGEEVRVTSIFFQEYDGLSHPGPDHPVQVSLLPSLSNELFGSCLG